MSSQLVGSSFAGGALLPNYVNGRLLAAEDLATGQSTLLQRDTEIGQAAGPGVVEGLWVTASATALTVQNGLGITPAGEPVTLPAPVTLQLSIPGSAAIVNGGSFSCCAPSGTVPQAAVSAGPYLLTAMPACEAQGQAPMAIPPGSDTPVACTAQWQVEGVQFKAILIPLGSTVDGITVTTDNSRNLLAHWCYGTAQLALLGADPFNFNPLYRGLDQLSSTDLTPCDLPLCVFYWDSGSITFVDNWSVRRRVTRPDPADLYTTGATVRPWSWSAVVEDQRAADGEARFLQFQDQIGDLMSAGVARATVASDVFGLLPPAGLLPVALDTIAPLIDDLYKQVAGASEVGGAAEMEEVAIKTPSGLTLDTSHIYSATDIIDVHVIEFFGAYLANLSEQSGFVPKTFFDGLARFGGFLSWNTAYFALRQSFFLEPVPTASAGAGTSTSSGTTNMGVGTKELRTTYILRSPQNVQRYPVYSTTYYSGGTTPTSQPAAEQKVLITAYLVAENVAALINTINGNGEGVTPYLVFIANQWWPPGTVPPFGSTL